MSQSAAILRLAFVMALICNCACSLSKNDYLEKRLTNIGPIALSPQNPYLGPNLYITRAAEKSPLLKGFIEHRGEPEAIELQSGFFEPEKLYLYYLDKRQGYLLERKNKATEWFIRGPERMAPQILLSLNSAGARAKQNQPKEADRQAALNREDQNRESSALKSHREPTANMPAKVRPSSKPTPVIPQLKQKTKEKQASLEISNSGDIIHRVSFSGETLRIIANWYTKKADNADRIARINDIKKPNVLQMGQRVRIPRYLLKNESPLTAKAVKSYLLNRRQR